MNSPKKRRPTLGDVPYTSSRLLLQRFCVAGYLVVEIQAKVMARYLLAVEIRAKVMACYLPARHLFYVAATPCRHSLAFAPFRDRRRTDVQRLCKRLLAPHRVACFVEGFVIHSDHIIRFDLIICQQGEPNIKSGTI